MSKINVKGNSITILEQRGLDFISLTDLMRLAPEGEQLIKNWLRNKNTIEFLGTWEHLNNPDFNLVEFDQIRLEAGTNRFLMSGKQWIERTSGIGIIAKTGRYGGTYAHKDLALHFAMWISPEVNLLVIKEFQRLKEEEAKTKNIEWDYRRFLSKVNYRLQTDAIKENIIPVHNKLTKEQEGYIYADEAELLNVAVFGITSRQWRQQNPEAALQGYNIRDLATIPQLTVLANLESINSHLIGTGEIPASRFNTLKKLAVSQLKSLSDARYAYPIESPHATKFMKGHMTKGELDVPEEKIEIKNGKKEKKKK